MPLRQPARRLARAVPRGELGGGAGPGRGTLKDLRDTHGPQGAGRLRLGQGQQRRGLSVPEAGAHRLWQQQRRPLHAAVPRLQRGRAARRRGLGRGQQPGQRRPACRADLRHRLQPDGQPPGRRDLDEERRQRGAKIVLADPRGTDIGRHAWRSCSSSADTDVAMLNALIHTSSTRGWSTRTSSAARTEQLRGAREQRDDGFSPEAMAPVCGIPA
jgi:formate dehydrogenase major subunit